MNIQLLPYFRAALFVPILAPLIFMLVVHLLGSARVAKLPDFAAGLLMLPILSLTIAGGLYLLYAAFMAWFLGTLSARGVIIQTLLAPIYFAILAFIAIALWGLITSDWGGGVKVGSLAAIYALALGYAYVVVTWVVYFLLSF